MAYRLFIIGVGDAGEPDKHIYFPIADDATKYKSQAPGQVKGMRPEAIAAIEASKPYKGGDDILWRLHKLNIIDKHRLLLTVGSAFRSLNLRKHMMATMGIPFEKVVGGPINLPDFFVKPADRLFPLKVGDELFIDSPEAKEIEQMEFRFEIALGEPGIINGEPLIETLEHMTSHVENLITTFREHIT